MGIPIYWYIYRAIYQRVAGTIDQSIDRSSWLIPDLIRRTRTGSYFALISSDSSHQCISNGLAQSSLHFDGK